MGRVEIGAVWRFRDAVFNSLSPKSVFRAKIDLLRGNNSSFEEVWMALTMRERQRVAGEVAHRYQRVSKKHKGLILNEFMALAGYHRTYASWLLRNLGRKVRLRVTGEYVVAVLGQKAKAQRHRRRHYDGRLLSVLRSLWELSDYLCGKRLAPFIRKALHQLERFGEIKLDDETRHLLLRISPATIDRQLRDDRKKLMLKSRARTKPGTLLKHHIPIRTFSDWDDVRPGFCEMDLVGHDGGDAAGEFAYTLDLTDICTCWTETEAVRNRAQKWTFEAIKDIEGRLPFTLLGLDSDNGSEFINGHLLRYCDDRQITFTRSRPYRKNDNCFVEQKNYSVVRRAVGYLRYDTPEELKTLNELYGHLRLYTNFFQPVMKLREKTRAGSRVTKKYDTPKTPYERVLESKHMDRATKRKLRRQYERLNPAELKRAITKLQGRLERLATSKAHANNETDFVYNLREATNIIS